MANLSVSGTSNLGADVTTTGTQTYTGAVTLSSDVVLSTTNSNVTFLGSITGAGQDLTVSSGSGAISLDAVGTSSAYLGDVILNSSGTTKLNGEIYARSLEINSNSTTTNTVEINTSSINTLNKQIYRGFIELSNDLTLGSSLSLDDFGVQFIGNFIDSDSKNLTINTSLQIGQEGNSSIGIVDVNSIYVLGKIRLNGALITQQTQNWTAENSVQIIGSGLTIGQLVSMKSASPGLFSFLTLIEADSVISQAPASMIISYSSSNDPQESGSIATGGKIYSIYNNSAKNPNPYNLNLLASNTITINNDVGIDPAEVNLPVQNRTTKSRINRLMVYAKTINLFADITTSNQQYYKADNIYIGSNLSQVQPHNVALLDLLDSNDDIQLDQNLVRTLISEDPNITFNGLVDDTISGTHSLVVLAITNIPVDSSTPQDQIPKVHFMNDVGSDKPLFSLTARGIYYQTGMPAPEITGSVIVPENVSTLKNQTFSAAEIELNSPGTTTLYSQSGRVKMETNSYAMIGNLKLDYSFANRPEISSAPGLNRATDTVRDAPTDLGAGSLVVGFKRGALLEMIQNDDSDIVADVVVGDLEKSDNQSIDTLCDITKDENCPVD